MAYLPADLATQMQYLTNIPESPKLKRRSKVLSWISESEDMFEDAGVSKENTDGSEFGMMYYNLFCMNVTGKCEILYM